jgi:hypothetical protein
MSLNRLLFQEAKNRPRPEPKRDSPYEELLARVRWAAETFDPVVDLRVLVTRRDTGSPFTLRYVMATVAEPDTLAPPPKLDYSCLKFRHEVTSVDEFLARLDRAHLQNSEQDRRSSEREFDQFSCDDIAVVPAGVGGWCDFSTAGRSRFAQLPAWTWYAQMNSDTVPVPLVSAASGAPLVEGVAQLIEQWGALQSFRDGDDRLRSFNVVVLDHRGHFETNHDLRVEVGGCQADSLMVKARAWGWGRIEFGEWPGSEPRDLSVMFPDAFSVSLALVAPPDEIVDWVTIGIAKETSEEEIRQLIRRGETTTVEFKEWIKPKDKKFKDLEKAVCAMANGTEPGRVVLGVNDDGEVVWSDAVGAFGPKLKRGENDIDPTPRRREAVEAYGRWVRDELRKYLEPEPDIDFEVAAIDDEFVVQILVSPARRLVRTRSDDIWIRRGASTRKPTDDELRGKLMSR